MLLKTSRLTFLWCLFLGVQAHSQKIDSLKYELLHQNGEERFTILYDLVFEYLEKENYREALKYIEEAQGVAAKFDDSLHIVKAGRVRAQTLRRLDRTADAIDEFRKVMPISKRNGFNSEYELILNGLALAFTYQGNYDRALESHFECLALREKIGNNENLSVTLNNIGLVYFKLKNFEKALGYFKKALEKPDIDALKELLLSNIGLCYNELHDYTSAVKFINNGLKICFPKCSDATLMRGEFGLGKALLKMGKQSEAERHFLISYNIAQKQNDKLYQIDNLIFMARIKKAFGLAEAARKLLVEAESMANETQYNEELIWLYTEFSELYTKAKNYKDAAFYQAKYIILKDSIYSGALTNNLMRIQADYEERVNNEKIASQGQILKLKEETIDKQVFLNFLMAMVAVLFIMLALIFFNLSRQRKTMNVLLDRKVGERTIALEESLTDLRRNQDEQAILLRTISSDMKASVATILGLCALSSGLEDISGANIRYVKEFEDTAGRIAEIVNRVQRITES